ncbi:MAG: MarR family transcriptional regulator [Chloroflexota bacterium]
MSTHSIYDSNGYLLSQVCKRYRTLSDQRLEEIGLYRGQELIICELWQQDGLTQSDLVERLMVQPSTLTNALNSMEKAGLVQRRPDAQDQRVSRVYLMPLAYETWPQVKEVWDAIDAEAFGNLTLEERILLRRLLMQVNENLAP